MEISISDLMNALPAAFVPEKAGDTRAEVQFLFSGENGGKWVVRIRDGQCTVLPGKSEHPTLVFTSAAQDCLDIFSGKLDILRAYMSGRIQLKGDMGLAMRLLKMFSIEKFTV